MTVTPAQTLALKIAIDTYGHTQAIKAGTIASPRLRFEFADVRPMNRAFRPMVETSAFDVSEMAIATFMQAQVFGKPLLLVPLVLLNRFHHGSIVRMPGSPIRKPADLNGKRVGVRAYAQTTAVWVRGILASEYGVDLDSITWVVDEPGHLAEYVDPPNVVRAPAGASQTDLLRDGRIDAWIGGREAAKEPGVEPIVADVEAAELDWFERVGALPVNHMLVIRRDVVDAHPWVLKELFGLFVAAKQRYFDDLLADGAQDPEERFRLTLLRKGIDPLPSGVDALRRSLEVAIEFAFAQHMIPAKTSVESLFDARALALA